MFKVHYRYVEMLAVSGRYDEAVEAIKSALAQFEGNRKRESEAMTWWKILIKFMELEKASPEAIAKVRANLEQDDSATR